MKANQIAGKTIKFIHGNINIALLTVILLLIAFAGYALWDSEQIYQAADKSNYAVYKPGSADEGRSFQELQSLNADVIAWLQVYGTNIDYPVTQGRDNMKYVNTNAEGLYSLSGAIFLDSGNSSDFSDFNSILYGHHMEKKVMFGEIGTFSSREVFDSRRYGNLYFNGKDHGIEFFAFLHTDAYDSAVFRPRVREEARGAYLDSLLGKAMYIRDIGVTAEDRIVLLSTCSASSTNGRDILIGRLRDGSYDDQTVTAGAYEEKEEADSPISLVREIPLWSLLLLLILAALLVIRIFEICRGRRRK
ncbi:MAG: class B sortase [Oscillospiraceae bacterium]|nr:class B sortase [Oscillospiraceae bacterium]